MIAETDLFDAAETETIPVDYQEETEKLAQQIRQTVTRRSDITLRQVKIVGRNWLIKTSSGKIARQANKIKYLSG
jgi:acyl-coenzyme A synthetase/AMP-(fatty) acid ligase